VTPGASGFLDFFSYHSWSFIDGSVNGYFQGLDLLNSFGLDIPIAITEFGPTYEFNLYDEPQEMHQGAAFVAQTYADISQRAYKEGKRFPLAYSWWVLSDIFEEDPYRDNEPFIGCMGLTSREGIRKPAYNAYKFLAQLGNEQIELSVEGSGDVGGMAARDNTGGVQLIVYNAQEPGAGPGVNEYYKEEAAHQIGVTVSGLDPTISYDVTSYRIDDVRGNAYAAWQGLGRPTMDAMSDADWQSLRDVMESPAESIGTALCGESSNQAFSLSSPGVLFVTLTPSIVQ
jgi:beta-xylosidase